MRRAAEDGLRLSANGGMAAIGAVEKEEEEVEEVLEEEEEEDDEEEEEEAEEEGEEEKEERSRYTALLHRRAFAADAFLWPLR
ncbi:hypothetical protein KM043_017324 [Ampulex compressa]|nr:hypothetical protein KM043_017324 [Ampulex compressa]